QLRQPARAQGGVPHHALLARHGGGRIPPRRDSLPHRARGHVERERAGDAPGAEADPRADRPEVPEQAAARRSQHVARGRAPVLRRGRRVPHGVPLPADAAHVHGDRAGGPPSAGRDHGADARHPGHLPVGDFSPQPRRAHARDGDEPRARLHVPHVRRRLAPLMENDPERIKLMKSLLFSMPGSPIVYYGDEIGMGDNIYLGDRNGVRTPMQWSPDRNAGFSRADPQRLYLPPIMDPVYGYQAVNVEAQERDPGSLLNWTKRMLRIRRESRAFGRGRLSFLKPGN